MKSRTKKDEGGMEMGKVEPSNGNIKNYVKDNIENQDLESLFRKGAEVFGVKLNSTHIKQFLKYMELIKTWNKRINLTSITEEKDIIIKHFIDSLSISPYIKGNNAKLIDIGTGAGLPGIPLKIVNPELGVTLLDSVKKKIKFLDICIDTLNLEEINTVHGRTEDFGNNPLYRESFDIATARAVASMPVLVEYCLPFIKIGGCLIAMKGRDRDEVLCAEKALDLLGGKVESINQTTLPFADNIRNIVIIRKLRQTSSRYPRKAGKPSKMPLL